MANYIDLIRKKNVIAKKKSLHFNITFKKKTFLMRLFVRYPWYFYSRKLMITSLKVYKVLSIYG